MREKAEHIIQEAELQELEHFFEITTLPKEPIVLDNCSQIIDAPLFVSSHLSILKAQKSNKRYQPYLDRLIQFKYIANQSFTDNANQ